MGGSFKEGGIRTVTAARQEARAELDTHPPTPTSIHTQPHPTRPTPTPAHTHPQTMFFQLSYCFFSCSGHRIPPSLNEPPIRVLRVPNGGVAARFLRKHSVFRYFDSMNLLQMTRCGTLYCRRQPTRKRVTWIQSS